MRNLRTPLTEEDVRSLKLGETVYLSGPIVTGRDEMHIRALEYAEQGKDVPECLNGAAIFHCGPIMRQRDDGTWAVVAAGPTTSARMNKLEPEMIPTYNIRAIIGKGGMSRETADAMREYGCVYLAATGGAGALVPITGFANSVAAPAIEYQKEGQVLGIGCKIFTIAGPVILYGIFTSWLLGLGYWSFKCLGIL